MNVAIIEDHLNVRQALQEVLEAAGFQVTVASAEGAALNPSGLKGTDALIIDMEMPDLDGVTAVELLRKAGYGGFIVLMTGYPNDVLARRAATAGVNRTVEKTTCPKELVSIVKAGLTQRVARA